MIGLSLFSGIGGVDLAFEWAGGTVGAVCEIEPYCQKVLKKHWPTIPLFENVYDLTGDKVKETMGHDHINIIYGGFPCQPFSVAGKQKGKTDNRYLWPEFSRLVRELRPNWVLGENVPGILRLAADDVCSDLESQDYEVGIFDFEAAAVGAPHRRERFFFVAHAGRGVCERGAITGEMGRKQEAGTAYGSERPGEVRTANIPGSNFIRRYLWQPERKGMYRGGGEVTTYTDGERLEEQRVGLATQQELGRLKCSGWGRTTPGMGRSHDGLSKRVDRDTLDFWSDGSWDAGPRTGTGIPNRVARLKALGNAVVPQQVYPIFKAIIEYERGQM